MDRTTDQIEQLREIAQGTADDHGWTLHMTVEPQPGSLFTAVVEFTHDAPTAPAVVPPPAAAVPLGAAVAQPAAPATAAGGFSAGGRPLSAAALQLATVNLGGLDAALLLALFKKETPFLSGFLADRRPFILYERHVFSRNSGNKFDADHPAISSGTPYKAGIAGDDGYGTYTGQYDRLAQAMVLSPKAALMACSWGIGQTLGEGFVDMGYPDVQSFVADMVAGEDRQAAAAVREINSKKVAGLLKKQDFRGFALAYNGAASFPSYAVELEQNFNRYTVNGLPDLTLRHAQMLLCYRHFFTVSQVDGVMGPITGAALLKFQQQQGLPKSGLPDATTLARLDTLVFG